MLLQILPPGSISQGFIEFMDRYFPTQCNFIVLDEGMTFPSEQFRFFPSKLLVISSVKELITNKQCATWIDSADGIVINWVDGRILMLLSHYLNKMALVFWGGDLRSLRDGLQSNNPIQRLRKKLVTHYINESSLILTLIPGDYKELCRICRPKGRNGIVTIMTLEMSQASFDGFSEIGEHQPRVLVGNSATRTNRHAEAFSLLTQFKNIDIYSILSYGDMAYASQVIEMGNKLFKKRFHPVTEIMPPRRYRDFLNTVDIGIFNNDRQQGMGNIRTLLALGKKVYLSKDNPAFIDLIDEGFSIFDVQEIQSDDIESFLLFDRKAAFQNQRIGSFENLMNKAIKEWQSVFRYFEKSACE